MSVNRPSDPGAPGAPKLLESICLVVAWGLLALTTGQWNVPLAAGMVPVFLRGASYGFSVVGRVNAGLSAVARRWLAGLRRGVVTMDELTPATPGRGPWQ
jgi:hypothetical protein